MNIQEGLGTSKDNWKIAIRTKNTYEGLGTPYNEGLRIPKKDWENPVRGTFEF